MGKGMAPTPGVVGVGEIVGWVWAWLRLRVGLDMGVASDPCGVGGCGKWVWLWLRGSSYFHCCRPVRCSV